MKKNQPDSNVIKNDYDNFILKLFKCLSMECDFWDNINLYDIPTPYDNTPKKVCDIIINPSQRISIL